MRTRMHRGYLAAAVVCFVLAASSCANTVLRTSIEHLITPPPGVFPWRVNLDELSFFGGCFGTPVFAFAGLIFLYNADSRRVDHTGDAGTASNHDGALKVGRYLDSDWAWLGVDAEGHVAVFTTAGIAPV